MRLIDSDGYGVELTIAGYQFPDHIDPRIRYSWLVIAGTANCPEGNWSFRWQALSLDDTVDLADWLRRIAAEAGPSGAPIDGPARLAFTEPNLGFTATRAGGEIELAIGLDLEFSPPWNRRATAGSPFVVTARLSPADIATAAKDLGAEVDSYLPPGGRPLGRPR
ncbi:WapI family immunity protein [Nocardia sp. NPDC003963]